jgi:polyhydroxyalkanoate synthesis regulator protein
VKDKDEVIKHLKTCPIVQVACQQCKVSRATFYRWRSNDPKFRRSSDKALKSGCSFINDLAESQLISLIKDKNPTMIIYWLNHRHPAYSDQQLSLNRNEQRLILNAIIANDIKPAYQMLASNVVKGKISRQFFNSFSSIINRISKSNTDDNGNNKIDLLYKLFNKQKR